MRRTVFVAPLDIASIIQAACSDAVAARERRKLLSGSPSPASAATQTAG